MWRRSRRLLKGVESQARQRVAMSWIAVVLLKFNTLGDAFSCILGQNLVISLHYYLLLLYTIVQ